MSFTQGVYSNFEMLKRNFEMGLKKQDYEFDEDMFIDVCIKCDKTLEGRQLTDKEYIKYLWVAYLNTLKREKSKKIFITSLDGLIQNDEYNNNLCDEVYNEDIDEIYNVLIKSVREKFGDDITDAWRAHICDNKSYKELAEIYPDMKFNFEFKRIKKYILTKLVNKNKKINELMTCLNY